MPNAQPDGRSARNTHSCDLSAHQAGTSVYTAGSSASTAITRPTGTSRICAASMMIGIGHLRPSASIVTSGVAPGGTSPGTQAPAEAARAASVTGETSESGEPGEDEADPAGPAGPPESPPRPDPFSLRPSHVRLMRSRSQCP